MTWRTSLTTALAAVLATSACAGAPPATTGARQSTDRAVTTSETGQVAPGDEPAQTAGGLIVSAENRWGSGRALAAASADDGTTAIVTTASVRLTTGDGDEIAVLDEEIVERAGVVAISDDAAVVVTVTADPPTLVWHDTASRSTIATAALPNGGWPERLRFVPGTAAIIAETDVGPFVWTEPPTDAAPPITPDADSIAGTSALRASGVVITPLIGTQSLAVHRDGVTVVVDLDLPETASVQRAASAPTGDFVAIEASVGATEFDRPDQLLIVEPQRYSTLTTVPLGRDIPSDSWAVVGDLIAVTQGNRIDLLDAEGATTRTLEYDSEVGVARVSATTGGLITVLTDNRVLFWPADDWNPIVVHDGGRVLGRIDVSSDGSVATVTDSLGRVRSWSGTDGADLGTITDFEIGELTDVAIADDGTIAAGSTVGRIVVGDPSLTDLAELESSDDPVRVDSVAFRPGTNELATGRAERRSDLAFDDTLTLWTLADGTPRVRTGGEAEDVPGCSFFFHRLAYTADGATLATASHDRTVGIVDAATGAVTFRLPARTGSILDLAFAADDTRLVVSADDNSVEVWDTTDWSIVATHQSATGGYSALDAGRGGTELIVADVTGGLAAIDLVTGEPLRTFEGLLPPRPTELVVDPSGTIVASPLPDDAIGIWSIETGALLVTLTGHTDDVGGLAFSADGSLLVSAGSDGTLRSWSIDRA